MQRTFPRYFVLLAFTIFVLSILLVAQGLDDMPAQPGPVFDAQVDMTHRDGITERKPDLVLLGNSMLGVNVDTVALANSLGKSVYPIVYNGSGSAMWYLSIKNNILASPHKPQVVVILFRDTMLTVPDFQVNGNYVEMIDLLAGENESLLVERAYVNHMNPLDLFAQRYLPLYHSGNRVRIQVDDLLRHIPPRLFHCNKDCVDANFQKTFNFLAINGPVNQGALNQADVPLYTERALGFHSQVEGSFLPEIIRLCRENDIRLVLVRGKTVNFDYAPRPAGLDNYMRNLEEYLAQNGVSFVDFETDTRLTTRDFADRFHVIPEARTAYTQMLVEALNSLLP